MQVLIIQGGVEESLRAFLATSTGQLITTTAIGYYYRALLLPQLLLVNINCLLVTTTMQLATLIAVALLILGSW